VRKGRGTDQGLRDHALIAALLGTGLTQAFMILKRISQQANAHLSPAQRLQVSPHVLGHTLLRKVANEKGVHYAMELSGHRSDRYIWRYVRPDAQSLAEAIDELD